MNNIHSKMPASFFLRVRLAVCCTVLTILLCLSPNHGFAQDLPENEPDIQLEEVGEHTKVTQIAHFEFFGATLLSAHQLIPLISKHRLHMMNYQVV